MLAGLDQQRGLGALGIAEAAVVAHAHAGGMAAVAHDVDRRAEPLGQLDAAVERPAQHQRHAVVVHGMKVEQEVGALDDTAAPPGPAWSRASSPAGRAGPRCD